MFTHHHHKVNAHTTKTCSVKKRRRRQQEEQQRQKAKRLKHQQTRDQTTTTTKCIADATTIHPVPYDDTKIINKLDYILRDSGADDPWGFAQHPAASLLVNTTTSPSKYVYQHHSFDAPNVMHTNDNTNNTHNKEQTTRDQQQQQPALISIRGLHGYQLEDLPPNVRDVYVSSEKSIHVSPCDASGAQFVPSPYAEVFSGFNNHAVLGGKLTFHTAPGDGRNNKVFHHPTNPTPLTKKKRNYAQLNHQYLTQSPAHHGIDKSNIPPPHLLGGVHEFILQQQRIVVADAEDGTMHQEREEHHAFFPTTPNDNNNHPNNNNSIDNNKTSTLEQLRTPSDAAEKLKFGLNNHFVWSFEELAKSPHYQQHINQPLNPQHHNERPHLFQKFPYLFPGIVRNLRRKHQDAQQADWHWKEQKIDTQLPHLFNQYTGSATHHLTQPNTATACGQESSFTVSPHFLATYALDYLGLVSRDTTPKKPTLMESIEEFAKEKVQMGMSNRNADNTNTSTNTNADNNNTNDTHPTPPWHTFYQQIKSFHYQQHVPLIVPYPKYHGGVHQAPLQLNRENLKEQQFVIDVYAKVLNDEDHEQRKTYHHNLQHKMLALVQGDRSPQNTITLADITRQQPMYVKIWMEMRPLLKTTITSTEYRAKADMYQSSSEEEEGDDENNTHKEQSDNNSNQSTTTPEEEYKLPTVSFDVTPIAENTLETSENQQKDYSHLPEGFSIKSQTSQLTYPVQTTRTTTDLQHHIVETETTTYTTGTLIFEGVAEFGQPTTRLFGLQQPEVEQILQDMQSKLM